MRNPTLRNRSNTRKSGRIANTPQELWFKGGASNYNGSSTGVTRKLVEIFTSTDYTGTGPYDITWTHNLGTDEYQWSVIKTENNGPIIVEYFHQGADVLVLSFTGNTETIKVTITV